MKDISKSLEHFATDTNKSGGREWSTKAIFFYVAWALTPWAGDPSPRCWFQKQMEDSALYSKRGGWRDAVLCSLSFSWSLVSFQFIFRLMSFFQYFFFFLFPSLPPPVCASCLTHLPWNRKRRGRRGRRVPSSSQNSSWVQQWGRKHAAASHFCNLYHAFLEKWPVWSWGNLCPLTWLGCGGQRKGVKQGQGIQSGVLLQCCLLAQKVTQLCSFSS